MKNITETKYYWELFPDEKNLEKTHKELCRLTHPDLNKGFDADFKHVQELYEEAKKAIESGTFGKKTFTIDFGTESHDFYLDQHFEDSNGDVYLGEDKWIKIFKPKFQKLAVYEKKVLDKLTKVDKANFPFRTDGILPDKVSILSVDNQNILIFESEYKYISLFNLVKHFPSGLENHHIGWLSARLLENCYLYQQANLLHCNLIPQNVFVDIACHRIFFSAVGSSCQVGNQSKSESDKTNRDYQDSKSKTDKFSDYASLANLIEFASGNNKNFKLTRNLINRLRLEKGLRVDTLRILYDVKRLWKEEFGDGFFKLKIP